MDNHSNTACFLNAAIKRQSKESLLNQRAKAIWMTGLSGSGKTTLGIHLEKLLHKKGFLTQILDADHVRATFNRELNFTMEGRAENIRRIAEFSKVFLDTGIIVINCFISPTKEIRQIARKIIGKKDYIEVYVNTSIETCEKRDTKGLYKKVRKGLIENFTGVGSPYEPPENPDIEIDTENLSIEQAVKKLSNYIIPKITLIKK